MLKKTVILKPGKEKSILNRHHWIFSGAIQSLPTFDEGEILPVHSSQGQFLGQAYFNSKTSITGRMVSFTKEPVLEVIRQNMTNSIQLRNKIFNPQVTNAYRLINGEGDFLPGLIVDKYNDTLVFQISTRGMDRLKPYIIDQLNQSIKPKIIYEKSALPSRKEEGLKDYHKFHLGPEVGEVEIIENGLRFIVSITEGQKTGFFLDQREMRSLIQKLAKQKKVLNCFSYTGGFSLYAAAAGACYVVSLDISNKALNLAKKNLELNGFFGENYPYMQGDVFERLREDSLNYDIVILDPPAFAKKQRDVNQACRGYKDINRLAMQKMPPQSFLLTCSCSYHVNHSLFRQVIFQAAVEAKRQVRIVGFHQQASDHPINIYHPEGDYLKSLLLYIE